MKTAISPSIILLIQELAHQDIKNQVSILNEAQKQLGTHFPDLMKNYQTHLSSIDTSFINFAKKACVIINIAEAYNAGVFDELRRIHSGLLRLNIDPSRYENISSEDIFFTLKNQPESKFADILRDKYGIEPQKVSDQTKLAILSILIEVFFNILKLILDTQDSRTLSNEEIIELAAKSAVEAYRQIDQEQQKKQINPPRILTSPKHPDECGCTHHHVCAIPPSKDGSVNCPTNNGKQQIPSENHKLFNDNDKTQEK